MYTVRLRHKDKNVKCRFFVVPGDILTLLGMPDIELVNILKIICEVIDCQHENRNLTAEKTEPHGVKDCNIKERP